MRILIVWDGEFTMLGWIDQIFYRVQIPRLDQRWVIFVPVTFSVELDAYFGLLCRMSHLELNL